MARHHFRKRVLAGIRRSLAGPGRRATVVLILAVGFAASIAVFLAVRQWETESQRIEFDYAASHPIEAIRRGAERLTLVHKAIREYCYGDPEFTRDGFTAATFSFLPYVPSVRAFLWAPRIETTPHSTAEDMGQFPIRYAISPHQDRVELGWDVGADIRMRAAMARSRDHDELVATEQRVHAGIADGQPVVFTFLPVYRRPQFVFTVEDRQRELSGFLIGICSVGLMVENAIGYDTGPRGIDVWLLDPLASAGGEALYFHASRSRRRMDGGDAPTSAMQSSGNRATGVIDFGRRPWTAVCTPAPDFFAADARWRSWGSLGSCLLLTCGLAGYFISATRGRQRIERIVQRRTRDIRRLDEELRLSEETRALAIRAAHEETIHRLVAASLCRDEETGMHIKRTGLLSERLALAAGWSKSDAEIIRLAAPMHDVGKIGIPDAVLRKPGALTPAEYEIMKTHTLIGAKTLEGSQSSILAMAYDIALCHHERWDGTGYPRGLAGLAIPESARILSIVDVFDALSHDRVYRPMFSEDEVLSQMAAGAGTQFDPALLAVFFSCYEQLLRLVRENPDTSESEAELTSLFPATGTGASFLSADSNASMAAVPTRSP